MGCNGRETNKELRNSLKTGIYEAISYPIKTIALVRLAGFDHLSIC
jgi:hypothetical protein